MRKLKFRGETLSWSSVSYNRDEIYSKGQAMNDSVVFCHVYGYWPSVRSRWLDIGQVLFCVFMDQDGVEVHKEANQSGYEPLKLELKTDFKPLD